MREIPSEKNISGSLLTAKQTYSMELSPSREAKGDQLLENIPNILWNPKVSLSSSQQPVTGTYIESDEDSPQAAITFLQDPF
jgi:hypothetical protein